MFRRAPQVSESELEEQRALAHEKELREMYMRITSACFDKCIKTFAFTKHFLPGEADCVQKCALKHYLLSMHMGTVFADVYLEQQATSGRGQRP